MVTTASKLFYAAAAAFLVGAWAYGLGTDGQLSGVVFMGLKGAVGEHAGYVVLMSTAAIFAGLGVATSVLRDADPETQAAVARMEVPPPAVAPSRPSHWPVLGALAAVVAAVGLVASPVMFVIGLFGVGVVLLEWMVTAWSERATGDPAVNRRIRNRLMYPIEVPFFGAIAILVVVVSLSRVLLALDRISSSVAAIVLAGAVLTAAFVISYRPRIGKNVVAGLVALFGVVVIVGGIIAAASGHRDFEPHTSGQHTEAPASAGGGAELPAGSDEGEG